MTALFFSIIFIELEEKKTVKWAIALSVFDKERETSIFVFYFEVK